MRFLLAAIFFYFFTACKTDKDQLLSEKTFTEIFRDSLQKRHPDATYTIEGDLKIHIKSSDVDFIQFLNNAYTAYKSDPDSILATFDMYLKSADEFYKKEEPVQRNKIIPVIKDVGYLDEIAITLNKEFDASKLVFEKYNDKLIILYAEDSEKGINYFTEERFIETGLSKDSLLPIALKNLDAILPEIQRNGADGVYVITAGGNYEASLILLTDIWTKESMPVDGDIVISIPTRELLLVTGSNNIQGIKKIKDFAQDAWSKGPYQLLPDLFRWNGKKFEVFQ